MTYQTLVNQITSKATLLCVGLDTDPDKIPTHLHDTSQPVVNFNKAIIDSTQDLCVAYKLNIAFYEAMGRQGWHILTQTINYIPDSHFVIADAKRGDIGHTAERYATTFFKKLNFDAVTLSPYMGQDTVRPFLAYDNKWVILVALTSNASSQDFQFIKDDQYRLFEHVIKKGSQWGSQENMMFVVGATQDAHLARIRQLVPDHFLLIPGVGAQGGSLEEVCQHGLNKQGGLLINSSRSIIYAGSNKSFDKAARQEAKKLKKSMQEQLGKMGFDTSA
jgi:orotidine-5'-phosphate decarboxylase